MDPKELLGEFPAGRVLDLATGRGGMIKHLLGSLRDITEIIGVDTDPEAGAQFPETFAGQPVRFQAMDASRLEFPEASFDTVSIGNSLHHLKQLPASLAEMLRVLKPGGHLVILEMYRDAVTESQLTHVMLHHWWAAVDSALDIPHYETFTRLQLRRLIESLGLVSLHLLDFNDTDYDAFDPENLAQIEGSIDRYIQKAGGNQDLIARGEALRLRLRRTGFHGAPALLAVGEKAA